jgi:cupin superfamily acireductone dioxygenase involved in methionine salvage
MSTNFESKANPKKDQGKNIIIIVLVLLVIISGIKLYTDYVDRSKKTQEILLLSTENNELNKRLDSVTYQLDLRIQEIEKLGGDVKALEEVRDQLIAERNTPRQRSSNEIAALNEKIRSYNGLIEEKDQEILELRAMNQQLFAENQDLKTTQAEIEEEVAQLNIQKEDLQAKVNIAAMLKAENINIAAVNSRGKERIETTKDFKNRQIERIKVSFNFSDNKVAEKGPRNVYVQVLAPNSQPIFDVAKGSGTFMMNGVEEFYTVRQDIIFDNTEQELTFYYEKGSDYNSGTHEVRIFVDNYQIGSKTFSVK